MLWDSSLNAGFSAGTPWLPVAPNYQTANILAQRDDPASMLTLYHRLIALRRTTPALAVGAYTAVEAHGEVLAYMRTHAGKRFPGGAEPWRTALYFRIRSAATPGTHRTLHLSRSCKRGRTPHDHPARKRGRDRDVSVSAYRHRIVVFFWCIRESSPLIWTIIVRSEGLMLEAAGIDRFWRKFSSAGSLRYHFPL